MGQTISLAALYCCCSAGNSLCQSCFGTTAAGTTGRKRSVLLLTIGIAAALWFQYAVGPAIVSGTGRIWNLYTLIPGSGKLLLSAWKDDCAGLHGDRADLVAQCAGNAGVYRPMFLSFLYFSINAAVTKVVPNLNREAWPAKYVLFLFGLLVTMFVPSHPLFSGFFLWTARLGSALFVVLQQLILIDVAYNLNDDWVERANEADRLAYGSGSGWLRAIIGVCVALYVASIAGIAVLFSDYDSCAGNAWVISLSLIAIVGMTALQLSGSDGSLLTGGVMSAYVTYLCFTIVSKNPIRECNPRLGQDDVFGITVGLVLTLVSLAWTGWSWSAGTRLSVESAQTAKAVAAPAAARTDLNLEVPFLDSDERPTQGLVVADEGGGASDDDDGADLSDAWKLNVVLALISCYVAMILTSWGTVNGLDEDGRDAANPTVGHANMAILGVSQWLAIGLYCWTLVAPRLFPDRDFS